MGTRTRRSTLARLAPELVNVLVPSRPLLTEVAIVVGRLVGLVHDVAGGAALSAVLVGRARDLLTRSGHVAVVPGAEVLRLDHRQRSGSDQTGGAHLRRERWVQVRRRDAVDDVGMRSGQASRGGSGSGDLVRRRSGSAGGGRCRSRRRRRRSSRRSIASLGRARALLPGEILLGETLLARLALPVVVAHAPAVDDDAAAELAEHRLGRDDGDLARAIRVGQDALVDEVVLLELGRDDLVQRPVLVEEQVRVAVAEDAGALGREHEELVAAVGHEEGAAAVLAAFAQLAVRAHLLLARLVELARDVLVALGPELIGGVVAHGRQRLDDRLRRRCLHCNGGGRR